MSTNRIYRPGEALYPRRDYQMSQGTNRVTMNTTATEAAQEIALSENLRFVQEFNVHENITNRVFQNVSFTYSPGQTITSTVPRQAPNPYAFDHPLKYVKYGLFRQTTGGNGLVIIKTYDYCSAEGPDTVVIQSVTHFMSDAFRVVDRLNRTHFVPLTKLGAMSAKAAGELPPDIANKVYVCTNRGDLIKPKDLTWDILDFDPVQLALL